MKRFTFIAALGILAFLAVKAQYVPPSGYTPASGAVGGATNLTNANAVTCTASAGVLKECGGSNTIAGGLTSTGLGNIDNSGNTSNDINAGRNFNGKQFQSDTGVFGCGLNFVGCTVRSSSGYSWSSTTLSSGTIDTTMYRAAAGVVEINAGTAAGTGGSARLASIQSAGTKFTTSGCSVSSTTGGATSGKFTLGANTCSVIITMNGATGLTAPNGWSCRANDQTTAAGNTTLYFSSNNATTATLSVPATAGTTDVIDFACMGN